MEEIQGGGRSVASERCKLGSIKRQFGNPLQDDHRIPFGYLKEKLEIGYCWSKRILSRLQ